MVRQTTSLPWIGYERTALDLFRERFPASAISFTAVTDAKQIPADLSGCDWISWSCHGRSDPSNWGRSYLTLGDWRLDAATIAETWALDANPVVVLGACETAVDASGLLETDEICGVDLAFRIAGARAVVSALWRVEDLAAAITVVALPQWRYGLNMTPDTGITGVQRHFQQCDWKRFLLTKKQLLRFPPRLRKRIEEMQEPLWALNEDRFSSEDSWAVFRCHGY